MQRTSILLLGVLVAHAGCSAHAPASPVHSEPPAQETAPPTTLSVERTLSLSGFTETLADGYVVGVRVRNDDQHDRVVLTSASTFQEVRFVDAMGGMIDRVSRGDRSISDASCETMDGVLLRPGETLRLAETFVEADPQVAVIAAFELRVSEPGAAQPVSPRRFQFRAELGELATDVAASTAPPRFSVLEERVFASADAQLLVGVSVRNDGDGPALVPAFGLLHAAASLGDGAFSPLVGRSSPSACPLCPGAPGLALCDGVEGVLVAPGEVVTLVAGQEEALPEDTTSSAGVQARVAYLFDGHSLICDVPAVRAAGEFGAVVQPLR